MITVIEYDESAHYRHILHSVENEQWQTLYEEKRDEYRSALKTSCTLIAQADGRYAGYVRAITDGSFTVFVAEIIVDEPFRRMGLGTRLLHAVAERYPSARIDLISDNDAFYQSDGFHAMGRGMRRNCR